MVVHLPSRERSVHAGISMGGWVLGIGGIGGTGCIVCRGETGDGIIK